jgi:hypothetical protein
MRIAVLNQSQRVTDADVATMCAAVDRQVKQHFCPAWNRLPVDVFFAHSRSDAEGSLVVVVLDKPDVDDALGYHEETGDVPDGKIFVSPVLDNGGVVLCDVARPDKTSVASVLSHEVLEALGDPDTNLYADGPAIAQGSEYAVEVCDPVEADSYVVQVPDAPTGTPVAVSNFVLPAWFDPESPEGVATDYLALLKSPFQLRSGGYMVVRHGPGTEEQVLGMRYAGWKVALRQENPRSRLNRRLCQ